MSEPITIEEIERCKKRLEMVNEITDRFMPLIGAHTCVVFTVNAVGRVSCSTAGPPELMEDSMTKIQGNIVEVLKMMKRNQLNG
jgi:hypothetical protein